MVHIVHSSACKSPEYLIFSIRNLGDYVETRCHGMLQNNRMLYSMVCES